MTRDVCLKGDAIVRFRFLLEQDYPFEKATELAQDPVAVQKIQWEVMHSDLKAKSNSLRETAVRDESSLYSKEYRLTFIEGLEKGFSLRDAAHLATRKADTMATLSDTGNVARPVVGEDPTGGNPYEIRLAIASADHPTKTLKERHANKIRKGLSKQVPDLDGKMMPHLLECTWLEKFGYMRVVCADQRTARWLKQSLPKLDVWHTAMTPFCVMSESKMAQAGIYTISLPDSADDSVGDIFGYFQSQNTGLMATNWKVISKQLCDDKTTLQLLLTMPEDPDEKLLQAAGYELNYKFSKIKFTKPNAVTVVSKTWGSAAYAGQFPDTPTETAQEVLKFIESQNEGIAASQWVISEQKRFLKDGKKIFRLVFVVDAASDEKIKRANRELNYKFSKVQLHPQKLKQAERNVQKATHPIPQGRLNNIRKRQNWTRR